MADKKKIIKLSWRDPSSSKVFKDDGWISNKSESELSFFIKKHYHYEVECCCNPKAPIKMILSNTGGRNSEEKRTYFIQNKNGQGALHHPNCLYYKPEAAPTLTETKSGYYEAQFNGFKTPTKRAKKDSSNSALPRKKQLDESNQLYQFATQFLLNSASLMTYSALNRKEELPPSWKRLYNVIPSLLNKTYYKDTNLKMGDFYLKSPRGMNYPQQKETLAISYGPLANEFQFLTQGRVLEILIPSESKYQHLRILKVQTQSRLEPDSCSYLWISKSKLDYALSQTQFSYKEVEDQGIWWFFGTLPQSLPTRKATLLLKGSKMSFAIPEFENFCLIPLAQNGIWASNQAELSCFNGIYTQKQFIKKNSLTDKYTPFKKGGTSTFIWITPSVDSEKKYHYTMGHISFFKGTPTKQKDYEAKEIELLSRLAQEKMSLWHWDYTKNKKCPTFPTF